MLKRTIPTIVYYLAELAIALLLNESSPSGPCTPGVGIFAFMLLAISAVPLLFRNIFITIKIGKDNLPSTFIHSVACLFTLSIFTHMR